MSQIEEVQKPVENAPEPEYSMNKDDYKVLNAIGILNLNLQDSGLLQ